MKLSDKLIDDARQWWRMRSIQINLVWGVVCQVFVLMPREQQAQLISLLGIDGEGAITAFNFLAQVSAGVAAATITARLTRQPGLHAPATNQPPEVQS